MSSLFSNNHPTPHRHPSWSPILHPPSPPSPPMEEDQRLAVKWAQVEVEVGLSASSSITFHSSQRRYSFLELGFVFERENMPKHLKPDSSWAKFLSNTFINIVEVKPRFPTNVFTTDGGWLPRGGGGTGGEEMTWESG